MNTLTAALRRLPHNPFMLQATRYRTQQIVRLRLALLIGFVLPALMMVSQVEDAATQAFHCFGSGLVGLTLAGVLVVLSQTLPQPQRERQQRLADVLSVVPLAPLDQALGRWAAALRAPVEVWLSLLPGAALAALAGESTGRSGGALYLCMGYLCVPLLWGCWSALGLLTAHFSPRTGSVLSSLLTVLLGYHLLGCVAWFGVLLVSGLLPRLHGMKGGLEEMHILAMTSLSPASLVTSTCSLWITRSKGLESAEACRLLVTSAACIAWASLLLRSYIRAIDPPAEAVRRSGLAGLFAVLHPPSSPTDVLRVHHLFIEVLPLFALPMVVAHLATGCTLVGTVLFSLLAVAWIVLGGQLLASLAASHSARTAAAAYSPPSVALPHALGVPGAAPPSPRPSPLQRLIPESLVRLVLGTATTNAFFKAHRSGVLRTFGNRAAAPGSVLTPAVNIIPLVLSSVVLVSARAYGETWSTSWGPTTALLLGSMAGFVEAAGAASTSLVTERTRNTWPLLMLSGLPAHEVLQGKLASVIYTFLGSWVVTVPFWALTALACGQPVLLLLSLVPLCAIACGAVFGLWQASRSNLDHWKPAHIALGLLVTFLLLNLGSHAAPELGDALAQLCEALMAACSWLVEPLWGLLELGHNPVAALLPPLSLVPRIALIGVLSVGLYRWTVRRLQRSMRPQG